MLQQLVPRLVCPHCRTMDANLRVHVFTPGEDDHVRNGILSCCACGAWYPINDDLLELTQAALLDQPDWTAFKARFSQQLAEAGVDPEAAGGGVPAGEKIEGGDLDDQLLQRKHFDWFADNPKQNWTDFSEMPFWKAVDALLFDSLRTGMKPGDWVLDLGCANGVRSRNFIDQWTVTGFDISKKMIRQAIESARQGGYHDRATFFVGDGNQLAFKSESFEYVQAYGVLHHLPNPGQTVREVARILKPGGRFFAKEGNKTPLRGIFDWTMRLFPLWQEEAGPEPLVSRAMVEEWCRGLPVDHQIAYRVYLPPHLLNVLGNAGACWLLRLTDLLLSHIPGIRTVAGLILITLYKRRPSPEAG